MIPLRGGRVGRRVVVRRTLLQTPPGCAAQLRGGPCCSTKTIRCWAEPHQPDRRKSQPFQWLARLPPWFSQIDSLPTDSGPNPCSGSVLVHGVDREFTYCPLPRVERRND